LGDVSQVEPVVVYISCDETLELLSEGEWDWRSGIQLDRCGYSVSVQLVHALHGLRDGWIRHIDWVCCIRLASICCVCSHRC
jgi:hypothetical protein